jgi:uroporphyrinogen-III decarboxylase
MSGYFASFGPQVERLRTECGMPSAIAGILKAPFDIIADKLRGYVGLTLDMATQPEKVLAAAEALAPHLCNVALATADPAGQVPVGFWMHRGCVPFVSPETFESHYWPTLRPVIEELWRNGHQTLFYAEGDWDHHLDAFATLPERSIVYHVDRGDLDAAHRKLGGKFCMSGGVPNFLLSYGKPDEVRAQCRKVIDGVAKDGGYVLDASAIMQDDTSEENLRALTEFAREYGVYSSSDALPADDDLRVGPDSGASLPEGFGMPAPESGAGYAGRRRPGVCVPWEEKRKELPQVTGDEELLRRVWEEVDSLGSMFVWQFLVSF